MVLLAKGSSSSSVHVPPWMWMVRTRQQIARYLGEGSSSSLSSLPQQQPQPQPQPQQIITYSNPHDVYFSPLRDRVALLAPYPLLPSMALRPGHAFASRHADGTPLVVYRDKTTTQLHAYVNACRHRGSPLIKPCIVSSNNNSNSNNKFATTPLTSPVLTCPYHAWTYHATTGALMKIPGHSKAFGSLDATAMGLQPLTCREEAGMVWIGGEALLSRQQQDEEDDKDSSSLLPLWNMTEMDAALQPFLWNISAGSTTTTTIPKHALELIGYQEWQVPANWQLLVETALESYHVKTLHHKTLHQVTHPTWAMHSEWMDDHLNLRHTVPLRNFDSSTPENGWTDQETRDFLGQTTTTFILFPTTAITLLKRLVLFTTFEPILPPSNTTTTTTTTTTTIPRAGGGGDPRVTNNATATAAATTTTTSSASASTMPSSSNSSSSNSSSHTKIRAWGFSHRFFDANDDDTQQQQVRDFQALLAGVQEDWDCMAQIQQGLNAPQQQQSSSLSNASTQQQQQQQFIYGGYETNNVQYLHNVGRVAQALEDTLQSTTTTTTSS